MQGGTEFVSLIKDIAVKAVAQMKPCQMIFATVERVEKDSAGEVTEADIRINDKLLLSLEMLVFGQAVPKNSIKEGDRLILLQQAGGQLFYVMDKGGRGRCCRLTVITK